jgi:phosphate-selective porin OprO/OprP
MFHRQLWLALALVANFQTHPACAQESADQQKIQELEKKIEELDRRLRIAEGRLEPPVPAKAIPIGEVKSAPLVTADQGGFAIKSPDGNYSLKIGADLQTDIRTFSGTGSSSLTDQILLRRVRPSFSGTIYKYVDYYLRPDFGQGQTILYEGYLQLNYIPRFQVRVGKFKPPVGLQRLQSDDDTSFIERGLPTLLAPSRDIGVQVSGDILKRRVSYQAGVFNGVPDNGLSDSSPSGHRDYAGRIFMTPFQAGGESPLSGLGFGFAASGGSVDNVALPSYKTAGQNTFFTFNSGVTSAGHRTRLAPQGYYYIGPFGIFAEYTVSKEGFQKNNLRRNVAFRAWGLEASWILTGEKKGFVSPAPRRPFAPFNRGWGAWELAARVGDFRAENGLFTYGFADPARSPGHLHEWLGGVNWYLNRMVRISMDYGNTNFGGGALNADRAAERVILARFQIAY